MWLATGISSGAEVETLGEECYLNDNFGAITFVTICGCFNFEESWT